MLPQFSTIIANIDGPIFIAEVSNISDFSTVDKVNQFCHILHTRRDNHVPHSEVKVGNHNSFSLIESTRYELLKATK